MVDGFHIAMVACAVLSAAGGILAWLTISSEVLEAEAGKPPAPQQPKYSCAVVGTPLRARSKLAARLIPGGG